MESKETQKTISDWCEHVFGPVDSLPGLAARANKEMAELLQEITTNPISPKISEECADVVICLYRLCNLINADLNKAVINKMAINRKRTWKLDGHGHGQHV